MSAEEAIRSYVAFLTDPSSVRDEAAITKAQKAVDTAKDPVDKLLALAELHRVEQVDGSALRKAFVSQAKTWADANGVPASAFSELGIPADDLADAGFETRRSRRGIGTSSGRSKTRAPRVSTDEVRAAALGFGSLFTAAELMDVSKSSPGTVRKVISDLVTEKKLKDAGTDPDYSGRGRAPTRYDNS